MNDCIFCKIAKGEIPCEKIWENESFISFLDTCPSTEGMSLVIPKIHLNSHVFENNNADVSDIMLAAKKVSLLLKKGLGVDRVAAVFEGIEVDHLHLKLYPLRSGDTLKKLLNSDSYNPTKEELHEVAEKIIN